jgi:hypothetical protein
VATHQGGYTPFEADVTDGLVPGEQTVVVQACDDPHDLSSRGQAGLAARATGIWYERTSRHLADGVGREGGAQLHRLDRLDHVARTMGDRARSADRGRATTGLTLTVSLEARGRLLARDTYEIIAGEVSRRIALSDPGSTTTGTSSSGRRARRR